MEFYLFIFKLVVTMMLLKMVLAIVFEAYKSVVGKQSKKAQSVGGDLDELGELLPLRSQCLSPCGS